MMILTPKPNSGLHPPSNCSWSQKPFILKKLFETIFYPTRKNGNDSIDSEILNFCVAEKCRGQGIGRLLFSSAEEEFGNNSVVEIKIVTGIDQKAAQRFYESCGAKLAGSVEVHKNMESLIYNYQLVKK